MGPLPSTAVGGEERCERLLDLCLVNNALACTYWSLETAHRLALPLGLLSWLMLPLRRLPQTEPQHLPPPLGSFLPTVSAFHSLISSFLFNELGRIRDDACLGGPCALAGDDPIRTGLESWLDASCPSPVQPSPAYPGLSAQDSPAQSCGVPWDISPCPSLPSPHGQKLPRGSPTTAGCAGGPCQPFPIPCSKKHRELS